MGKVMETHLHLLLKITQQEKKSDSLSTCQQKQVTTRLDPCAISNTIHCWVIFSAILSSLFAPYELLIALQNQFLSPIQKFLASWQYARLGISIYSLVLIMVTYIFFLLLKCLLCWWHEARLNTGQIGFITASPSLLCVWRLSVCIISSLTLDFFPSVILR